MGSVTIDCTGCGERSIVSPIQAIRAAFPSVLLGLDVTRGDSTHHVGRASQQAWLRCPACRHRRWVHLSVTL